MFNLHTFLHLHYNTVEHCAPKRQAYIRPGLPLYHGADGFELYSNAKETPQNLSIFMWKNIAC